MNSENLQSVEGTRKWRFALQRMKRQRVELVVDKSLTDAESGNLRRCCACGTDCGGRRNGQKNICT